MRVIWTLTLGLCLALAGPAGAQTQPENIDIIDPELQSASGRADPQVGPVTGFPMPRYVSLRPSEGRARRGPSRSHRIDWVFTREGGRPVPLMVVAEHEHWRRVIDRDGEGGWMHYTLLTGTRAAIVQTDLLALHARPDSGAMIRAHAELGVTGRLAQCIPDWCLLEVDGHRGWVDASALWGVDPGEVFD